MSLQYICLFFLFVWVLFGTHEYGHIAPNNTILAKNKRYLLNFGIQSSFLKVINNCDRWSRVKNIHAFIPHQLNKEKEYISLQG